MRTFWREPLVHFVLLGLALFIWDGLWRQHVEKADYTITVSAEEIERQAVIFAGENRRAPTDEDIRGLVFAYVEEQVLMREAERLGLDADDTIIRRRLAQKMRFLTEDVDPPALPEESVLRDWFEVRQDRFLRPARRSFSHVYLSPTTHAEEIETAAHALLQQVTDENWKDLGDPFMLSRGFSDQTENEVSRQFGPSFAKALFALDADAGGWQGPNPSAFGLHLVHIDGSVEQAQPSFEEAYEEVARAWQEETRRTANQERLQALIKKYKVDVSDLELDAGASGP